MVRSVNMFEGLSTLPWNIIGIVVGAILLLIFVFNSIQVIGPTEIGLVVKRIGAGLREDNPIALSGEAGYQADLLMPGLRFVFWPIFAVEKFPWVQIPAGEIGVVVAQAGDPLPIGAKSAKYDPSFGNFTDARSFLANGGQKGVQRPVLPPGTLVPIHPVAFLVITRDRVYGRPVSPDLMNAYSRGNLTSEAFGLDPEQLEIVQIRPLPHPDHNNTTEMLDMIGIVTTLEGDPLPSGHIAGRLGDFDDIKEMEDRNAKDSDVVELMLGNKNSLHNNYQDFQAFLDNGGKIGLQHDPLLYGAYTLNPFLIRVEPVPMLVVQQGQTAVIKAYVGLQSRDVSGDEFKYGALVQPGHRGIWKEPLRTGKYPINPRCYQAEIVPTAILTLNWAEAVSQAHNLDRQLNQIIAKSKEGFIFKIDLQVQIHVPDTQSPNVISAVGTMHNLVNEVLQAAVGNHFRDKLQSMPAIKFIETRQQVQIEAEKHIREKLAEYRVETKGVYIQDVVLPVDLVAVLTQREIANQEIETYNKQKDAQETRIAMEQAKGIADMQEALARSQVGINIKTNEAEARKKEADGEATYVRETGAAKGAEIEAIGLARAKGYAKQVEALGKTETAMVNMITALSAGKTRFVPEVLVTGGGSSLDALLSTLTKSFMNSKSSIISETPIENDNLEHM